MVARSNLVADDPRRMKRAVRSSGLIAAWLLLIAIVAAVLAWLFANADETRARWSLLQPRAVVALPTDIPSQWAKETAPTAAPAIEAPSAVVTTAPMTPAPVLAPEPPRGLGPAPDP